MGSLSLYIHIPFCKRRCPYCDFVVNIDPQADIQAYLDLCYQELLLQKPVLEAAGYELSSIYFGGGTPSLAPAKSLGAFIEKIQNIFSAQSNNKREITLECNPEDSSLDFQFLRDSGINRLSVGAQSMRDKKLELLGRMHRRDSITKFVDVCRAAGFSNLSLDIIFGTPGESLEDLTDDIRQYLSLAPEHISAYELTIERGTNFFEQLAQKKFSMPTESNVEEQMLLLDSSLTSAGYIHYEISNYAKPGFESKHNSAYWEQKEYLGLGIGAHSFINGTRRANVSSLKDYKANINAHKLAVAFSETLTIEQYAHELLLLGFRTKSGIDFKKWNSIVGPPFEQIFATDISEFLEQGWCTLTQTALVPTLRGMMVADALAGRCLSRLPQDLVVKSAKNP